MGQPPISGFMVVRNVASQGYPFVEAIRSVLPMCDEFLVSDGCSTDDPWCALEIMRPLFGRWIYPLDESLARRAGSRLKSEPD